MAVLFLLPFYFLYLWINFQNWHFWTFQQNSYSDRKKLSKEQFHFCQAEVSLTQFRLGRGWKKTPTTSFSPVTSTNVGIGLQNFLVPRFNHFARLVSIFKTIPSASPKLLSLNWGAPKKICFSSQIVIKLLLR